MSHRRTRLLVAVPAAALLAVSLVGCGNAIKDKVENDLKDQGISVDLDNPSNIEIDSSDFNVVTGKLPKDYPSSDVPVVDGKILQGATSKNAPEVWDVTVQVGDAGGDKSAAFDSAAEKLTAAGLSETTAKTDAGTSIYGQYTSAKYVVDLAVTDANGLDVNYTVTSQ